MTTFNILNISDVHLGHRRTPTKHIIESLKGLINRNTLKTIDMLIIAGDLFDHAISYSDDDTLEIQQWLILLLSLCADNNVALRVLEGTPLHDRGQSKHLNIFNKSKILDLDFLYVNKVWIEKNERFGLNILYVPDEWRTDPDETWVDVNEELSQKGLKNVDISVMHGMFEYQIPTASGIKPHVRSRYENITNRYIVIGHIHQSSHVGKVIAPGSTDRLTHSDEKKKGGWRVELNEKSSLDKFIFVENKNALEYITVDCVGLSFDAAIEKISSLDVKSGGHIRVKIAKGENRIAIMEWCRHNFYQYNWTDKIISIEEKNKTLSSNNPLVKGGIKITIVANSLISLLETEMSERNIDSIVKDRALEIAKEYVKS